MTYYEKMSQTKIPKLVLMLAIPTIISMLITNIYNLVDTYFVGTLSVSESGSIGVVFTLMTLIQAFAFMFGHGSGSIMARRLADKDELKANKTFNTGFIMGFIFSILLMTFGLIFIDKLVYVLGSTETIFPYAKTYVRLILIAAPAITLSFIINNALRYQGKATFAMIGLLSGGIINIILDPIFILNLKLGVFGAGLATLIGQYIGLIVLIVMFIFNSNVKFSKFKIDYKLMLLILLTGLPSLLRQGLNSISSGILNNVVKVEGDYCVSAMSIVNRCMGFMLSVAIGIGQGFQPISSFSYQTKSYKRLKQAFFYTFIMSSIVMLIVMIIGIIIPDKLVSIFIGKDLLDATKVIEFGSEALRYTCIGLLFTPIAIVPNMLFQSTGLAIRASILSVIRAGVFFIPIILILPKLIGLEGIKMSQMLADILAAIFTIPFVVVFFKKLKE